MGGPSNGGFTAFFLQCVSVPLLCHHVPLFECDYISVFARLTRYDSLIYDRLQVLEAISADR